MPRRITQIPVNAPIVTVADGTPTVFFLLRWQGLIDDETISATIDALTTAVPQSAAIITTTLYTAVNAGRYRVTWYLRKTHADGVSSSLTVTVGWSDKGQALTFSGPALTLDTSSAFQSGGLMLRSDANVDITIAVAYASNTPTLMTYDLEAVVEFLS